MPTSWVAQPLRLAERSKKVFAQGLVVSRSIRFGLKFVVIVEQAPPPHHYHARVARGTLGRTLSNKVVLSMPAGMRHCDSL